MMRSLLRWSFVALAVGAAAPALAQNYRVIGAWRCIGAGAAGPIVYDVVFNADGSYSGIYTTVDGYRAYSEGPYRLTGTLLAITFDVWVTQPPSPSPGGETFSVQFRGGEAMALIPTRCPQGPDCRFACERHR
jgi:hypothetical protein